MKIGLIDVDGHNFPNLALMKIAGYYKSKGDSVKWHDPLFDKPDRVYASKIFTFEPDYNGAWPECEIIKGGTGYDVKSNLPAEIEYCQPDYSIYPKFTKAIGFLTRGCIRNCAWCIVPQKEGHIAPYMDIERIATRKEVILLDNNVLAHPYGLQQIAKISKMNIRIDFNQGLDARLINADVAKLLCSCKWIRYIRMSCDTLTILEPVIAAIEQIRKIKPKQEIWCYQLVKNVPDAFKIAEHLRKINVHVFAQAYRDFSADDKRTKEQIDFCVWVNRKEMFKSCEFKNFNRSRQMKISSKAVNMEQLI